MDAGLARIAQQSDPRKVRIVHGKKVAWSEVWEHNPRIAKPNEQGRFNIVYGRDPVTNMRGYHTFKTPEQWGYNLDYRPAVGELYFNEAERQFGSHYAGRLIIEPNIKQSGSPNKQWPWHYWQQLADMLNAAGIKPTQLGQATVKRLEGVDLVVTPRFRDACAVISYAQGVVLHESGLHHAAAALNIKGVVLFGGFTPVELTGYPMHRNLGASLGEACGMRIHCQHCKDWMASITPQAVFDNLMGILNA